MGAGTPRITSLHQHALLVPASLGTICLGMICLAMTAPAAAQQPATDNQNSTQASQPVPEVQPAQPAPAVPAVQEAAGQEAAKDAGAIPIARLGPGDLVDLNVYNIPELNTKARVSLSGDVYLPLVDYVHVGGLTIEEAQALIEKRLEDGGFVRNPHVSIFVEDAYSQGVTVIGEVSRPGIYPDPASHKLYQVISEAGGFTQAASRKIAIIRPNQADAIHIDLPRNLSDDLKGNVEVLPGDTINVPRAPVIYVVGDVGHPAGFLVDNGRMTVLEALALAGGTNHTAKMNDARLIRRTPAGMTEMPLQLKKMLEAKIPDVTLQADDILFVPISGVKVAATRSAEAALALATSVGIYTIVR